MSAPRIDDPAKTLERVYERIHETERQIADYEAQGFTFCAATARRRLAGLKSARTRVVGHLS